MYQIVVLDLSAAIDDAVLPHHFEVSPMQHSGSCVEYNANGPIAVRIRTSSWFNSGSDLVRQVG
jgi:hypothetical protein